MSLSINKVSYQYPGTGRNVLEDFSFAFKPGRFYGIFGANGSGKSTLLKLLAGDIPCKDVWLDGRLLNAMPPKARAKNIAVAEQENEAILPFTVKECIKLGCYIHNTVDDDLISVLLKFWKMEHLQHKMFAELSGGERQKVKLLRVLAQNTNYILLDEPASSLDWSHQIELYENLRQIVKEQSKSVIMICHDLYIAPAFIDEMLLIKQGRLIYSGAPDAPTAAEAVSAAFDRQLVINRSSNKLEISWS